MEKIEKIERKLYLYALYDKELKNYDMILTAYNDEDACKYYINEFKNIRQLIVDNFKDEVQSERIEKFLERIHNTVIYCVGSFDSSIGEFVNFKNVLMDLFDFNFVESEVSNDGK